MSLTPYSQVIFEGNRYSVPADQAQAHLVVKAYPLRVDILSLDAIIASHPRCYGKDQDIFDPLALSAAAGPAARRLPARQTVAPLARHLARGLRATAGQAAGGA